jgi:hypothetical protein
MGFRVWLTLPVLADSPGMPYAVHGIPQHAVVDSELATVGVPAKGPAVGTGRAMDRHMFMCCWADT